jgi:hypothetical protein
MLRHGVVVLLLAAGLVGCGSDPSDPGTSAPPPATVAPKAVADDARRETIYLEATAAHLCAVQSRVYTDPAEMAAAYSSRPRYAELTEAEVTAFDQRRATDDAFAARLAETIVAACPGPAASN